MNVYKVLWDGDWWIVEAPNFEAAVRIWLEGIIEIWKRSGDYDPETDDDTQPDSVELVSDNAVLREGQPSLKLDRVLDAAAQVVELSAFDAGIFSFLKWQRLRSKVAELNDALAQYGRSA